MSNGNEGELRDLDRARTPILGTRANGRQDAVGQRRPVPLLIVHIGTSGWQYADWQPAFYPQTLPQSRWLEYYAERFATVEANSPFYHLPDASVFEGWARRTPPDFTMAVKVSRYLTHVKRLVEPEEPVRRFLERARSLGAKLGPVLVQLPPQLEADPRRLEETLAQFPGDVRVAVEFRHASWFSPAIERLLARRNAALALADRHGPIGPPWVTADWTYVRLHEGRATPRPCYGPQALVAWAERLAADEPEWREAFVYFNNDRRCCAVRNAGQFSVAVAAVGLESTRTVPGEDQGGTRPADSPLASRPR